MAALEKIIGHTVLDKSGKFVNMMSKCKGKVVCMLSLHFDLKNYKNECFKI